MSFVGTAGWRYVELVSPVSPPPVSASRGSALWVTGDSSDSGGKRQGLPGTVRVPCRNLCPEQFQNEHLL